MPGYLVNVKDSDLLSKAKLMKEKLTEDLANLNLEEAILLELESEVESLGEDISSHLAAKANARSKKKRKDESTKRTKKIMRFIARKLRLEGVEKSRLQSYGITSGESNLPSEATRPIGRIDTSERFHHTIYIADEAAPALKRKPRGVLCGEVFVKIGGEPPQHPNECAFLTNMLKTRYVTEFDGADVGKQAHYMMRWRLRDGSVSSWSETVSATITG
jgi:hypothetical protein